MAANPQIVTVDCTLVWDGVRYNLMRGMVIDIPSGSAMLSATTYAPPQRTTTNGAANLSTRIAAATAQQVTPGSSDSIGAANMENAMGGGVNPYSFGQTG